MPRSEPPTSKDERRRRRLARISYAFAGLGGVIALVSYVASRSETPLPEEEESSVPPLKGRLAQR